MSRNAPAAASGGSWCSEIAGGVRLVLQVTPNAKKSQVIGPLEDVLKLRLQAQPIEGKANEALVRFLAELLDVPRSRINISHGLTSKRKMVEVLGAGLTVESVMRALLVDAQ
ncbi:hypothetical protein CAter282_3956 [Collimonas arenae]|uniref:UPF0235 protein CAter282_3956 n=1 Tax=Collimonas arenae TaxID=279058 RepID=A0A127QP58_9BURK|nr:DUF167 domain-containing protein [Collimonas arenae]AMP01728.1 hypothetical protein CAter10_4311 [Collimonas arenae]AMP11625.1 hypothetical protein CAter282_3956 [Collimonas arenae]